MQIAADMQGNFFGPGRLDEVAVYSQPLVAIQVADHFISALSSTGEGSCSRSCVSWSMTSPWVDYSMHRLWNVLIVRCIDYSIHHFPSLRLRGPRWRRQRLALSRRLQHAFVSLLSPPYHRSSGVFRLERGEPRGNQAVDIVRECRRSGAGEVEREGEGGEEEEEEGGGENAMVFIPTMFIPTISILTISILTQYSFRQYSSRQFPLQQRPPRSPFQLRPLLSRSSP